MDQVEQQSELKEIIWQKFKYVKFKHSEARETFILIRDSDGSIKRLKPDNIIDVSAVTSYEYYWVDTLLNNNVVAMVYIDTNAPMHSCKLLVEKRLTREEKEKILETIVKEHFCESLLKNAEEVEFSREYWEELAKQSMMDP